MANDLEAKVKDLAWDNGFLRRHCQGLSDDLWECQQVRDSALAVNGRLLDRVRMLEAKLGEAPVAGRRAAPRHTHNSTRRLCRAS